MNCGNYLYELSIYDLRLLMFLYFSSADLQTKVKISYEKREPSLPQNVICYLSMSILSSQVGIVLASDIHCKESQIVQCSVTVRLVIYHWEFLNFKDQGHYLWTECFTIYAIDSAFSIFF